ncbi:MAG: hypothetical protein GWN08_18330 [Gemmatimonadetes bacterium]|nr:hypothetical protein [Gemmatimonadota bacterium]NIW77181.1 hypothetical protein [Gemmatimonadota bacterium]
MAKLTASVNYRGVTLLVALTLLLAGSATGQDSEPRASWLKPSAVAYFPVEDDRAEDAKAAALPLPSYGGWVTITKWATLAASVGLGAWGFKLNDDADDIISNLERICQEQPTNCRSRNPDGSYTDPTLESMFQRALDKDDRARTALVASQLFFGASVVLFIVDFQRDEGPDNIPYEPDEEDEQASALRLSAVPGTISLRYYFR